MLKRELRPGLTIVYRRLGDRYRVLTDTSAYPEAARPGPTGGRGLVFLDQEEGSSGSP